MTRPFITIRPAEQSDFEQLCLLWRQLDEFHRIRDPNRFHQPGGTQRPGGYIDDLIDRVDRALLVAESRSGQLVGLCSVIIYTRPESIVKPAGSIFELDNLVVDELWKRKGIARLLHREAVQWSRNHGATELTLKVYAFNVSAQAFYESIGFKPVLHHMACTI